MFSKLVYNHKLCKKNHCRAATWKEQWRKCPSGKHFYWLHLDKQGNFINRTGLYPQVSIFCFFKNFVFSKAIDFLKTIVKTDANRFYKSRFQKRSSTFFLMFKTSGSFLKAIVFSEIETIVFNND